MTRTLTFRTAMASAVVVVALTMTGCAAQQSDYGDEIADRLQSEVLEVSQLSAASDFAGAMLALTELEVELKDARARGQLTEERYESILAATALVRADLQAAIDALAPPPAPEVNTGGDDDDDNESNEGNGNSGNGNEGNGNNGNGNSGKGEKDKDKNKDD